MSHGLINGRPRVLLLVLTCLISKPDRICNSSLSYIKRTTRSVSTRFRTRMARRIVQVASHLASKMAGSEIVLYTAQTPNGIKVSILLEELGLKYEVRDAHLPV